MTVKQLIGKLKKLPQSHQVVVDKGQDGSPLDSVSEGHYEADSTWSGALLHPDDVPDHENAKAVVVLHPVN